MNDLFKYSNIFVTLFPPKYGDSGEFGDDGKTVYADESDDSCEFGDSSKYGNFGKSSDSG